MRRRLWAEILIALMFMAACSSVPVSKPEKLGAAGATGTVTTRPSPAYTSLPSATSTLVPSAIPTETLLPTETPLPSAIPTETLTPLQQSIEYPPPYGCCDLTGLTVSQIEFLKTIRNARYITSFGDRVHFTDGHTSYYCRGVNDLVCLAYLSRPVFGDLNSDGVEDAVVILLTYGGSGSSIAFELAAVINRNGEAYNTSTIYLDDPAQINDLQIKEGSIVLDLFVHKPEDAHCCPTQHEIWRLNLIGGKLTPLP